MSGPSRLRSLVAVAGVAALVAGAPRPAAAQNAEDGLAQVLLLGAGGAAVLTLGATADVLIYNHIQYTGHAPLALSLMGTAAWVLLNAGIATGYTDPSMDGARWGVAVLQAGALAGLVYAVYGLVRGPPPVAVTPTVLHAAGGDLTPGLALVGRF